MGAKSKTNRFTLTEKCDIDGEDMEITVKASMEDLNDVSMSVVVVKTGTTKTKTTEVEFNGLSLDDVDRLARIEPSTNGDSIERHLDRMSCEVMENLSEAIKCEKSR